MLQERKIYLDHSATTPVDPRVLAVMLPYFTADFGNPASTHQFGQRAESAVENAREEVARVLGCLPEEVIFTSGGSEADNLAVRGVTSALRDRRGADHVLTTGVEHLAVSGTASHLSMTAGFQVEVVPVSSTGQVDPAEIERRLRPQTALVTIIYANNEIGTINSIAAIGRICQERGVPLHTDALQAVLSLELDVNSLRVDLMSLGAHKFYGPKGVGVLYVRRGCPIYPVQTGGEQEYGMRGGTLNVPLIIGMAEALKLARQELDEFSASVRPLRDDLVARALDSVPDSRLTGHPSERLPYHASFVFDQVDGNLLINLLDAAGFACSSGSACKTGSPSPSGVLLAIGLSPGWALGSLRVTLGRGTTAEETDLFCSALPELVDKARRLTTR